MLNEARKIADRHQRRIDRMDADYIMDRLRGLNRKEKAEQIKNMMRNTLHAYNADIGPLLSESEG